ncbi:MAG: hypothetical protein QHJ73_08185 [Armatimonadota bacterium]|nr:hypothetical protein [Armatimonadota bacterium]
MTPSGLEVYRVRRLGYTTLLAPTAERSECKVKRDTPFVASALVFLTGLFLLWRVPAARAVSMEEAGTPPRAVTWCLAASSWNRDDYEESVETLGVKFNSKVRPLIGMDYQLASKFSVGAWYNAVGWDMDMRWDYPPQSYGSVARFKGSGYIFEVHGTMDVGNDVAVRAGIQQLYVDWDLQGGVLAADFAGMTVEDKATKLTLWGMKTFHLGTGETRPLALTLAVGLAQGLSGEYATRYNRDTGGSVEVKDLTANLMVRAAYALTPVLNADASVWLADLNSDVEKSLRVTVGVSGRF